MPGLHRVAAGLEVFVASEVLQLAASPVSTVHTTGSCTWRSGGERVGMPDCHRVQPR